MHFDEHIGRRRQRCDGNDSLTLLDVPARRAFAASHQAEPYLLPYGADESNANVGIDDDIVRIRQKLSGVFPDLTASWISSPELTPNLAKNEPVFLGLDAPPATPASRHRLDRPPAIGIVPQSRWRTTKASAMSRALASGLADRIVWASNKPPCSAARQPVASRSGSAAGGSSPLDFMRSKPSRR